MALLSSVEEFWFSLHEIFSKSGSYYAWYIGFCGFQFSVDFSTVAFLQSLSFLGTYLHDFQKFSWFYVFSWLLSIWLQFLSKWYLSISLRSSRWRTWMHATLPAINEALTKVFWVVPSLLIQFKAPDKFEKVWTQHGYSVVIIDHDVFPWGKNLFQMKIF